MKILDNLINFLGRENYKIDSQISKREIVIILIEKFHQLLRGYILKFQVNESYGPVFLGKGCKIRNKHKIILGRTIFIGDNVEINALSKNGITIGNNVSILKNTIIECTGVIRHLGEQLIIGNNVGIAQNCLIQVRGKVLIGNNVIFGPNVSIFSENHVFDNPDLPVSVQGESRKGVVIEDGDWISIV